MARQLSTLFVAPMLMLSLSAAAQQAEHEHAQDNVAPQTQAADKTINATEADPHETMDHSSMSAPMADSRATPDGLRDPHAYAEGEDFGPLGQPRMADTHNFGAVIVDRLESANSSDNSELNYDLQAWYGRTFDRLTLKAEGEVDAGKLQDSRTELLWAHAFATFWDAQAGVRHDTGVDPDRTWLAVGVQGLAPYWFEVEATAYLGEQDRSALRLSGEYELLLTQKLVLQPRIETTLYGKSDKAHGIGSGLSDAIVGLRLRYEITRQFAPYVGVEWVGKFGGTADFAKAANEGTDETHWVAGLRLWF